MIRIDTDVHFDIEETLTCGQAFRYSLLEDGSYETIARGKRIRVKQEGHELVLTCSMRDFDGFWKGYFDLGEDYGQLKERLVRADDRMAPYIDKKPGIHILRQDPFEMVITFILSQNKSMPQIRQLVQRLSETYGPVLTDEYGSYRAFPEPEDMFAVTEETFRSLKVGFRAPYLVDAVRRIHLGELDLKALETMPTEEARMCLMTVKGIGRKVADCILLFGYHRLDVFPLDVWMKRAVTELYFHGEKVSEKQMLAMAQEVFGDLAGIAQQYIFFGTIEGM